GEHGLIVVAGGARGDERVLRRGARGGEIGAILGELGTADREARGQLPAVEGGGGGGEPGQARVAAIERVARRGQDAGGLVARGRGAAGDQAAPDRQARQAGRALAALGRRQVRRRRHQRAQRGARAQIERQEQASLGEPVVEALRAAPGQVVVPGVL